LAYDTAQKDLASGNGCIKSETCRKWNPKVATKTNKVRNKKHLPIRCPPQKHVSVSRNAARILNLNKLKT